MQRLSAATRTALVLLSLLLIGFLVYWPGLSGGYVFDDFGNLVENPALTAKELHAHFWPAIWSSGSSQLHRPLSMLSFATQMWFTGLAPWPLKLGNVLIHLFNAVLIYFISYKVLGWLRCQRSACSTEWLLPPSTLALLLTAAWLLAPIQLTAILYVVQRMESLAATFLLLGLLAWWHGRMRLIEGQVHAWPWIWGGLIGGTVLSTLAKETGVMLPVYAFLLDWLVLGFAGRGARVDRRLFWVFALVLFLPAVIGLLWLLPSVVSGTAYANRDFDLVQRLWTEGRVMVDYLYWIILPTPNALSLYHDDIAISTGWLQPWTTLASWSLIAGLVGMALWLRRRMPLFALGVLWFFAGQILVSTVLPLELAYEHRNYLPSLGVFLALVGVLFTWEVASVERRRQLRLLVILASLGSIALYAGFTAIRAQIWGDPYRLAYFEATSHPLSPRANYDLARAMMTSASGVDSPGYQLGEQLMEKTMGLPGAGLQPVQALIFMAAKNRKPVDQAWWKLMRTRIETRPVSTEDVGALYGLVHCGIADVCHYSSEDTRQLKETLAEGMRRYPNRVQLVTLAANFAANVTHDYNYAYRLMLRAVVLGPNNFQYWKNLMVMQMATGHLDDAGQVLERLRELNFLGTKDAEVADLTRQLASKTALQRGMSNGARS